MKCSSAATHITKNVKGSLNQKKWYLFWMDTRIYTKEWRAPEKVNMLIYFFSFKKFFKGDWLFKADINSTIHCYNMCREKIYDTNNKGEVEINFYKCCILYMKGLILLEGKHIVNSRATVR